MIAVNVPQKCEVALDILSGIYLHLINDLNMNDEESEFLMQYCSPVILNRLVGKAEENDATIHLTSCTCGKCDGKSAVWVVREKLPDGTTDERSFNSFGMMTRDVQRMPL